MWTNTEKGLFLRKLLLIAREKFEARVFHNEFADQFTSKADTRKMIRP